jgi:hypothetical protein
VVQICGIALPADGGPPARAELSGAGRAAAAQLPLFLPFWTSYVVRTFVWMSMLGRSDPIATQFNLDSWGRQQGKLESMVTRVPAGRMGKPGEIAEAIVFLATMEGGFIHGHDLVVDGGYIIQ